MQPEIEDFVVYVRYKLLDSIGPPGNVIYTMFTAVRALTLVYSLQVRTNDS